MAGGHSGRNVCNGMNSSMYSMCSTNVIPSNRVMSVAVLVATTVHRTAACQKESTVYAHTCTHLSLVQKVTPLYHVHRNIFDALEEDECRVRLENRRRIVVDGTARRHTNSAKPKRDKAMQVMRLNGIRRTSDLLGQRESMSPLPRRRRGRDTFRPNDNEDRYRHSRVEVGEAKQ
jgi:hypothetical protein